jgi:hypothetical protein
VLQDFENLASGTGVMENVRSEDWNRYTIPSWRHSIWVGIFDPLFWMIRPHLWCVPGVPACACDRLGSRPRAGRCAG